MEFSTDEYEVQSIRIYRNGEEQRQVDYVIIKNYQSMHIHHRYGRTYELGIVVNSVLSYGIECTHPKKLIKKYVRSSKLTDILAE